MKLDGRICIVTGAGRGIGEAITHRFSDEGATVAVQLALTFFLLPHAKPSGPSAASTCW